ncbi:MAG: hypothetical protein IT210_11955 [Armatimonadetes bacterium]|nr:hypothetical protein [Armatimonadota bacterium]
MSAGRYLAILVIILLACLPAPAQPIVPVPLPNPGFEEGAEGWSLPQNAAIAEDRASAGRRSARLAVADPMAEPVYITRTVPITGGGRYRARCRVKTEGVSPRPGRMESVGAGLIVEWADKKGRWFAAGDYATGLFGDNDWTLKEIENLRSPEQARFAIIYLALRGAGTAWFDEIEITREERSLARLFPPPGRSLRSNRPEFAWQDDPDASYYLLEFSRDPAFPSAVTKRIRTEVARARPASPLSPGRWHWRVTAPGYVPGTPWRFSQTAPADADTTPPRIEADPVRVRSFGEAARVRIKADGDRDRPKVKAVWHGKNLSIAPEPESDLFILRSPRWDPGLNRITLTASDAKGNAASETLLVLFRPAPARPVSIDPDGTYREGRKRIFPLGIYQVSPEAMPTVKRAGFEVVHDYRFEGSPDDRDALNYLDAAARAGLRVFIGFDRGGSTKKGLVQGNKEHIIERVAALCAHPSLFCWYLFDEPEIASQYISPKTLTAYANLIRRLDPYHPVVVTTWGPRMAAYRRSFDTHWTQAYTTPAGVVSQIEEHRRLLGPKTPITLLAHCYDRDQFEASRRGQPFDPARFRPDPDWMMAAAFAGVTQRVNGLWWWWYADKAEDWPTVADVPAAWEGLSQVVQRLQALEPVITDPVRPQTGSINISGGKIHWWRKRTGKQTTLIAVSTSEQPVRVSLPAPVIGPVDFGRYGVHIYRYR